MIIKKKSQMVKVNLVIDHKNWKFRYPKINLFITKSIKKILLTIFSSHKNNFEISILLTGSKNMKNLNKKSVPFITSAIFWMSKEKNIYIKYMPFFTNSNKSKRQQRLRPLSQPSPLFTHQQSVNSVCHHLPNT